MQAAIGDVDFGSYRAVKCFRDEVLSSEDVAGWNMVTVYYFFMRRVICYQVTFTIEYSL